MESLRLLLDGFEYVAGPWPLLAVVAGVAIGLLVGAMPGLSPSMGVALLVPFTYSMSPTLALVLLAALYLAADYGGAITAVTINTPGTPSSAVTAFDGYPLTRAGKAGVALGMSLVSSTVGGLFGTLILIFFSVPLAKIALSFYPTEYFALAVLGLATVATVGGSSSDRTVIVKSLVAALLGLVLNGFGTDPITGVGRFTGGIAGLADGFSLIPALIGLFALSEVMVQVEDGEAVEHLPSPADSMWPRWRDYWQVRGVILVSSAIGTLIGILPGAGATIASFVAYDVARRMSRQPEQFGRGSVEGVAAAEAANSSCVGGSLIPMLTLGIPGSASTAVLLSALMIHRVVPGPQLFQKRPEIIYGLFASQLVANFVALVLGLVGCRLWVRVTEVPRQVLQPLIVATALLGSYAVGSSLLDVACCLGFGLLGWLLRRNGFPVAPVVLGLVLGRLIEVNFRQAMLLGGYSIFLDRWPAMVLLALAALALLSPVLRRNKPQESRPPGGGAA